MFGIDMVAAMPLLIVSFTGTIVMILLGTGLVAWMKATRKGVVDRKKAFCENFDDSSAFPVLSMIILGLVVWLVVYVIPRWMAAPYTYATHEQSANFMVVCAALLCCVFGCLTGLITLNRWASHYSRCVTKNW